jgi:hypothetical protein
MDFRSGPGEKLFPGFAEAIESYGRYLNAGESWSCSLGKPTFNGIFFLAVDDHRQAGVPGLSAGSPARLPVPAAHA